MLSLLSSSPVARIADAAKRLRALKGLQRAAAAFGFGLLGALAFPRTNLTPVLWVSFPALIFLLQGTANWRQAFITGWSFAFGFLMLALYWIAASMFVDIASFWWAVPLAVAGLPAAFAIYYGIAAALAHRMGLKGLSGALTLALLWFLADYVRGHAFTGFPWDLVGHGWSIVLPILQITSIIGIYGLTLLTLITICLPATLADKNKHSRAAVAGSLLLFALIAIWGEARLMQAKDDVVPNVRLRLVQPNIDQSQKWLSSARENHFRHLLDLTSAPGLKPVTHIVWPETAATYYLMEEPARRHDIAAHLPKGGALLTGLIRRNMDEAGQIHYYNSLIAVDGKANVVAGYDKFHLVPFGEYIPFRTILPLRALATFGTDFSSGEGPRSLRVTGLPSFSPLICYEIIFPGEVEDRADPPHFLLNVTNDGWYGNTSGPYQHFAVARIRAIEEGRPLVRAANTGISGVMDSYGRVTARLGLGETGFVDADVPEVLNGTLFSQYGGRGLWLIFGLFSIALIYIRIKRK
ncbi:MAG: apolipoprotein N-acyltransferase [Alphaproteobacteria bacterium]|nr:apolipoprotein N-acyltransferase [Alphaproteobacteria bacterium]